MNLWPQCTGSTTQASARHKKIEHKLVLECVSTTDVIAHFFPKKRF